jgi:lipid-A-disaccharide synthase
MQTLNRAVPAQGAAAAAASGPRVVLAAGEASGDLLAGLALPALRDALPHVTCAGIAGDRMTAAGVDAWWHVRELSVRGYAEVLRHLPRLLKLRRDLLNKTLAWPAQVYVGVDAPDFNLGVEERLRARGVRTIQFVAPAVWAWRPGKIKVIRRAVDHLLAIFPFEQAFFEQAGVRCTYVGHPLARTIPRQPDARAARARLGVASDAPTLALLPGSRTAEVDALGPPFIATAAELMRGDSELQVLIPAADERLRAKLDQYLAAAPERTRFHLFLGRSHDVLEAADAVLVAGGTATLEAMLFKRPMVIAYKVPWLTEWLTRRKALIPYFGLPNILAQQFIVPEFLQDDVTPRLLAPAVKRLLAGDGVDDLRAQFDAMHDSLVRDTPGLFAQAIVDAVR